MSSPPPIAMALPTSNPKKRPSLSSAPSSSSQQSSKRPRMHPLRQTSFPANPDIDPRLSATSVKSEADGGSVTGSFTGSLTGSADGGLKGRRKKGRKDREGTGSGRGTVVDGGGSAEGGSIKTGTAEGSMVEGQDEGGVEEDEDDVDDAELLGGDEGTQTDAEAERKNLAILIDAFTPAQSSRYDFFKRAKLNKPVVRKIVNQTLSQSVPPNVITTISGYTKVFVGELVERARTVQAEWAEAADEGAIASAEAEAERKARAAASSASNAVPPTTVDTATTTDRESADADVKVEPPMAGQTNTATPRATQSRIADVTPSLSNAQRMKKLITLPPNPHRGQLLPSHLREALRRYKRDCEGGNVGFSGMSTNGLGVKGSFIWNARGVGGRRLFR